MTKEHKEKKHLIVLIGFMGSGKSTLGPILANTLGYDFIDLDALIERKKGKKITEIFFELGESAFRAIEQEELREIVLRSDMVVSLGGGTVTNAETLALLKKHGTLIYLKSDVEHIYQRLRSKSDRPMLRGEDGSLLNHQDLRQKIEDLMQSREPYYEQADLIMHTDGNRVGITVDAIVKKLSHYLANQ